MCDCVFVLGVSFEEFIILLNALCALVGIFETFHFILCCTFLHQADLSCRNTKQSVGAIFTRTNFVTLKYVTDGWGTDTNGFKLVITAVKDPSEYRFSANIHFTFEIIRFRRIRKHTPKLPTRTLFSVLVFLFVPEPIFGALHMPIYPFTPGTFVPRS